MRKRAVRDNQKGSALIPVVCILLVLAAITLSMLFAAYQVYTTAVESSVKERVKVMAESVDSVLAKELQEGGTNPGSLRDQVYQGVDQSSTPSWTEGSEHFAEINLKDSSDVDISAGDIKVRMSWNGNATGKPVLTTVVKLKERGQQYTVTSIYNLGVDNTKTGAESYLWTKVS